MVEGFTVEQAHDAHGQRETDRTPLSWTWRLGERVAFPLWHLPLADSRASPPTSWLERCGTASRLCSSGSLAPSEGGGNAIAQEG